MKRPPILHCTALIAATLLLSACGAGQKEQSDFFTSGSHQADQRAEQRMAKSNQLNGPNSNRTPGKKSLYERLGGDHGLRTIVDDFVARAIADPRVNWSRKGITGGGFLGMDKKSAQWNPSRPNIDKIDLHITQFLALSTGGPTKYEGGEMKQAHAGMKITNPEFDAAIGDMKATLDKMGVGVEEQKELLAILESTRPQIVEKR